MALSALLVASTMAHNDEAKPWTFWYWMYGAVSKAGIHADLVGMKNVGLGGTYLMPIRGVSERPEYQGEAAQLSPKFWEMVDYSFQQADSLGLDMGIHHIDALSLWALWQTWHTHDRTCDDYDHLGTHIHGDVAERELRPGCET